jgi:putative ABC transport system permease protein
MDKLWQDVRFGVRWLCAKPATTLVAVATLSIGIGATTAIVSVVNSVLLRPLPFPEPQELVVVWQDHTRIDGPATEWASPDNFFDWRDGNDVFEGMTAVSPWGPTLSGTDEPELLLGIQLSHDGLALLGIEPALGRGFVLEDDTASSALVVAISDALWKRRFQAKHDAIGASIVLDGEPATIVGVLPPGARFPVVQGAGTDIVSPLRVDPTNSCGRGCVTLRVVARLKDDVSLESARAEMSTIAARLEQEYPDDNTGVGVNLVPLHEQTVGSIRVALLALLGAVGFVLLIACANVANLLLSRATDREREVATRVAMGASRMRVLRQLLTESVMLAATGAAAGLVMALWGVDWLVSTIPASVPRFAEVTIDTRVLGFTILISVLTGLAFGLAPALRASRASLSSSLKEGLRGASTQAGRLRGVLVVVEVAAALMLLVGAGLLMRSFTELIKVDPGFDPRGVITTQLNLVGPRYDEPQARASFVERLLARVRELPGVQTTGVAHILPLTNLNADADFLIEGRPQPRPHETPVAWYRSVTTDFFQTLGMRLLAGRFFSQTDDRDATPVVVINEEAARRYWPNEDPLLSRVRFGGELRQVVGVVADTRHFRLDQGDRPSIYVPYDQISLRLVSLVARVEGDQSALAGLAGAIRSAVHEVDPALAVASVTPMSEIVADAVVQPRMTTTLFTVFALSALVLAAIGLYGVMSYSVGQRTHEVGLRIALGASTSEVLRWALRSGVGLLAIGGAIGIVGALFLTRFLEGLLFEVATTDATTFLGVPVLLGAVALLACYIPAVRAARVDPVVALRHE